MNSASRGLRPTVGLRRPGRCLLRRRRPTLGAERLGRPISNRREGLCRPGRCLLRRRRPTPGAQRLGRPISIGVRAFGRRSACTPNEFGLQRPLANGRPVPTGEASLASAEADAWRGAPWEADFNQREGLRLAVGLRRPGGCLLRRRRPTPGAQRPGRPISISVKACADRGGVSCVGGGRRLARKRLGRPISIGVKAVQLSPNASLGAVRVFARASRLGLRRTG
jgi:hypothetical protein